MQLIQKKEKSECQCPNTINILFMSTYPPRECGIATFTRDLSFAIGKKFSPSIKPKIAAINRNGVNVYNYPKNVLYQINDNEIEHYRKLARDVNKNECIKLVNIQHEFGIFRGEYGGYILEFLKIIKKPVIITFHSIISSPKSKLKKVIYEISKYVKEIIVMNNKAVNILRKDYGIISNIEVIPHGIPDVPFNSQEFYKKELGLKNKIVLSSFGMIGKGKGYEQVIESLPKVIKKFPDIIYLMIGQTHPVVRKESGESYRNFLEKKIKDLGLQKNVKFYNKYLESEEIIKFLSATDVYMSSSEDPNQITSGTLAYSMGIGRAIISTPFLHAQEDVNEERGILVNFKDSDSFSNALIKILSNKDLKENMEKNNYLFTRKMIWPNVAISYKNLFEKYIVIPKGYELNLPKINFKHILRLTNKFGMVQFTKHLKPDLNSGYTLDDNSRALLISCMLYNKNRNPKLLDLIKIYLKYIKYVQQEDGKLYNMVNKFKEIIFDDYSEDSEGRAIKALGYLISLDIIPNTIKREAEEIFIRSIINSKRNFTSPRAISSLILGLCSCNKKSYSEKNMKKIKEMADFLVFIYSDNFSENWNWFEPYLTYDNGILPEALFHAYISTQNKKYLEVAILSLNFLIEKHFKNNIFVPIGQRGWYIKDGKRSYYDQQPLEATSMILALLAADKIIPNRKYKKYARNAFQWFFGKNTLNQNIYNETTGGCHDGLGQQTINLNQGAESTISYLIARLSLEE